MEGARFRARRPGRRLAAAGLCLWLACGPAGAAPAPSPRIEFKSFALPNGLRVILAPDHSAPIAALALIYGAASRLETPGHSGFAHLFEHLMFQGSRHAPKGTFERILEANGGYDNAETHEDFTIYFETMPSNVLPLAIWLEADRLSGLQVVPEALRNQIAVVGEEKRLSIDNQPYQAMLQDEIPARCFSNWHNSHSTMGSFKDLEAASLKDVQGFFDAYYAPSDAVLAAVGDFDPAQARRWIERYFAWIPDHGGVAAADVREPGEPFAYAEFRSVDEHAKLPAVALEWRGMPERRAQPDYYALALLGNLLFHGDGSRLYQRLVKESRLAVSVEGGLGFPISDFAAYKAPSLFGGFIVFKPGRRPEDIRDLVEQEIRDIAERGPSKAELERVKIKFRSDWIRGEQTVIGRAQLLLREALLDGDPAAANGELDRFMKVGAEDIRSAAARYFGRQRLALFAARPKTP